jgi:hypothetical protein
MCATNAYGQTLSRRPDDSVAELKLLRRQVADQARRIDQLEKAVEVLKERPSVPPERAIITPPTSPTAIPVATWQLPLAWTRLKNGMSRTEVVDILGQPSSTESVMDYQTLTYKDTLSGSGSKIGIVKLTDDRVTQFDPPDF